MPTQHARNTYAVFDAVGLSGSETNESTSKSSDRQKLMQDRARLGQQNACSMHAMVSAKCCSKQAPAANVTHNMSVS